MDLATRHLHSLFVWEGKRKCLGLNKARARFPAHRETQNNTRRDLEQHPERPRTTCRETLSNIPRNPEQRLMKSVEAPPCFPSKLPTCRKQNHSSFGATRCIGQRSTLRQPSQHAASAIAPHHVFRSFTQRHEKEHAQAPPMSVPHALTICPEKPPTEHSPTKLSSVKGHPYCFSLKNSPVRTTT